MEYIVTITFGAEDEEDRCEEVEIAIFQGYQITRIDYPPDRPHTIIYTLYKSAEVQSIALE